MDEQRKQSTKTESNRPWLNSNGLHRSDTEIKEISKSWDMETWEAYLQSIEVGLKETLLKTPDRIDHFVEDYTSLLLNLEKEEKNCHLRRGVQLALRSLTKREHEILELHFIEKKNSRQIAEILSVSRRTVRKALERGLAKIEEVTRNKSIQRGVTVSKILAAHFAPISPPNLQKGERGTHEIENSL